MAARVRFSGGLVLDAGLGVWLVGEPGTDAHEVVDPRPFGAGPVVVGPPEAKRKDIDRARRQARRLIKTGGPLVAAAGVDLGRGFRTAHLEGGDESRRDAVLAAAELLGVDQLERLGERGAVLVALFGPRATRRVGQAALAVLAAGQCSSLRLAVAASDLLGPEHLEEVLRFSAPVGVEAVPRRHHMAALGAQLDALLAPFTPRRRLSLLRSLWDEVVRFQMSAAALARARRRRVAPARLAAWRVTVARADEEWWRTQAAADIGPDPGPMPMLTWVPGHTTCAAALHRAFRGAAAATVLLRTAMAAEEQPVETAVLAHLDQLAFAATAANAGVADRVDAVRHFRPTGFPASDRAGIIASATVLGSDPGLLARFVSVGGERVDRRQLDAFLAEQLKDAYELAEVVLRSCGVYLKVLQRRPFGYGRTALIDEWRAVAGPSPARDPGLWMYRWAGPDDRSPLGARLHRDPEARELLDDGLWFADLADTLARWYGHDMADIDLFEPAATDVDPVPDPHDPRAPLLESIPLAVAGVAQLLDLGATPPARPASWTALAEGLLRQADQLGFGNEFPIAAEVAGWDGRELPETQFTVEVARTAGQLAEWGNYMGNCIAGYAEDAAPRFALVALRDRTGKLVANVSLVRGTLRWRVDQALARFNEPLAAELEAAIREWVENLPVPVGVAPVGRRRAAGGGRRGGGRRAPARERLNRVAAMLGDAVGDLREAAPAALCPVAVELGWTGEDGDWLSPYVAIARPRRPGPLAAATARAFLAGGASLAEVWHATAARPLTAAIAAADLADLDLRRLADATVPPSLRLALRDPRVWSARVLELASRRVRTALGELLADRDERLDSAVVAAPHTGFVTAAVLTVTARPSDRPVEWIAVAADGGVPGRPASSVSDPAGPWALARVAAVELGAPAEGVEHILADAPRRFLLVPGAWLSGTGWPALWARSHRIARETAKTAAGSVPSARAQARH